MSASKARSRAGRRGDYLGMTGFTGPAHITPSTWRARLSGMRS